MNGEKLKKLREEKGIYQKDLGKALHISPSTIGMYEQNRREPDNSTLKRLANYFEVSTDYLLDNEGYKYKNEDIRKLINKTGIIENDEILTEDDINRFIKFLKNNKEFFKK